MNNYINDETIMKICEKSGFLENSGADNVHIFRCKDQDNVYVETYDKVAFIFPRVNDKFGIYGQYKDVFPGDKLSDDSGVATKYFNKVMETNNENLYTCNELSDIAYIANLWNAVRYELLYESSETMSIKYMNIDQNSYISKEISID